MRQLRKNKKTMYYSNYQGIVDITDGYTQIDGVQVPIKKGTRQSYSNPAEFSANLSVNSGNTFQSEYGLDVGDYNAIISAEKGNLPFTEQTLIWDVTEPQYDGDNNVLPESADYKVIAIKTSLNEERFILKARVVENG